MGMQPTVFLSRTRLVHGAGAASTVGKETSNLGITRALLVTDNGIRDCGILDGIKESLASAEVACEVFDGVTEDATVELMHEGALRARDCRCAGVVVVGGGSPICAGRGIALEATNAEKVSRFEGVNRYSKPPLPVICLPTTAGSGSDVSAGFVVHDEAQERVYAPRGDDLYPSVSILDPLLLQSCPTRQMVYSGLDALAHAMDAIWVNTATPITDAMAFEAVRLIMTNLRRAAFSKDIQALDLQHLASTMASIASTNSGLGLCHGMTMYYRFKAPHGYQAAMLLPYVMEFNMPACEAKLARIAIDIGETAQGRSNWELAELALHRLKELYLDLGFPRKFEESEFPVQELTAMARIASENFFVRNNARKATEIEVRKLYELSLRGWGV